MTKDKLEQMCRMAGMAPAVRECARGAEIFVADGYAADAETFRKFGGNKTEFPFGAYMTLWSVANGEDRIIGGGSLLFDAFHDPSFDVGTKKIARVNTALKEARGFLQMRERVRDDEPV